MPREPPVTSATFLVNLDTGSHLVFWERFTTHNRPKLFRKTNISNNVAGALHPVGGRSGSDTVGLFTFLTLSDFQSFAK